MDLKFYNYKEVAKKLEKEKYLFNAKDSATLEYWLKRVADEYSSAEIEIMQTTILNYKERKSNKQNQIFSMMAIFSTFLAIFIAIMFGALSTSKNIIESEIIPQIYKLSLYVIVLLLPIILMYFEFNYENKRIEKVQTILRMIKDYKLQQKATD